LIESFSGFVEFTALAMLARKASEIAPGKCGLDDRCPGFRESGVWAGIRNGLSVGILGIVE
jgi:hypothetical protein